MPRDRTPTGPAQAYSQDQISENCTADELTTTQKKQARRPNAGDHNMVVSGLYDLNAMSSPLATYLGKGSGGASATF